MIRSGGHRVSGLSNIHPFALVELGLLHEGTFATKIGDNTKIWAFAYVGPGAQVGSNCTIGQGAHIGPKVKIGDGCKIQNAAQLFEGVKLADEVFIGPCVVFTNVSHPRAAINRHDKFKHTKVERGATIGANATILCGVTIGEYAIVGAGAMVTSDVAPHEIVAGNPARHSNWACQCGARLVPGYGNISNYGCPECAIRYRVGKTKLERIEP